MADFDDPSVEAIIQSFREQLNDEENWPDVARELGLPPQAGGDQQNEQQHRQPALAGAEHADHGEVHGDALAPNVDSAQQIFHDLDEIGIDLGDVWEVLEDEGVQKFVDSWDELLQTISLQLNK